MYSASLWFIFLCHKKYNYGTHANSVTDTLNGGVIYLYKISEILYSHLSHNVTKYMCLISGLCLETYLVQYSFFTDNWNSLFPLNLLIVIIIILITAYVTRSLGRVFTQIFSGDNIDWNKVFTI